MNDLQAPRDANLHMQLDAVIAELRPNLHRYCARLVGSIFDGEDIVQDVLVKAMTSIGRINPGTPLRPWLFRIAHNRAIDHLRSQALRRIETFDEMRLVDLAELPDEVLEGQEAVEAAFTHFSKLPVAQRSAVILKDVLGYSLEDIANLLELSTNAVKAVLSRGRSRLKLIQAAAASEPGQPRAASVEARTDLR